MNSLLVIFIAVFVLVLAAVCGLLVLRMLGTLQLPDSPPFPRRRHAVRHRAHPATHEGGQVAHQAVRGEVAAKG